MKTYNIYKSLLFLAVFSLLGCFGLQASSHREAPLIAFDPLADNTDVYAFRSPDDPNTVTIIANYVPGQLPHGGPNYYSFGEDIRYEIHIDNDASTTGDDIIYRFTFSKTNQDGSTFFNIRLGQENLKTTYMMEKSTDGGASFTTVVSSGIVPPYNIGARSITGGAGLGAADYASLFNSAITTASSGETVFCGPTDDPFFVDLGGIFDLGDAPRQNSTPRDGLACFNVSTIAIKIPIADLQKDGKSVSQAANILDPDFVIGVWSSASRRSITTLNGDGTSSASGSWVQVSRLGMPLTNEAVIPIGDKDQWNAASPYNDATFYDYFYNPELALYMDDSLFGGAVPAFADLRIQRSTSPLGLDFGNGKDGLFVVKGSPVLNGTAMEAGSPFENFLLPKAGAPRSVDLNPIFHTGVPNLRPYQLATGKGGNPVATGKPFINNFLPNGGDMLRLNMAVPVTARNSADFSSLGLVGAAVLGLTDARFNGDTTLQNIPNMDGFPNGRRLEDDVTRIELQAVGGVVLAAIGLGYDDPAQLGKTIGYTTGVEQNDAPFQSTFPYVAMPWSGAGKCGGKSISYTQPQVLEPTEKPCGFKIVSDASWTKSTTITQSNFSGNWGGTNGNVPAAATFTTPVTTGWPYAGIQSLEQVEGAELISTGNNITYFRKEFTLTSAKDLDVRLRMTVDDQSEVFINGTRVTFISSFGKDNWRLPAHDVKFMMGMNPANGFMSGDSYNAVTNMDLDNILTPGTNEIIVVVRNLGKSSDKGGFSFRMDVDSCAAVNAPPACDLSVVSNGGFMKSTTITPSSFSGKWNGAMGNLPAAGTFTDPVMIGQPYNFQSLDSVDGANTIKAGNNISYYRAEFTLKGYEDLNARFRTTVDDQAEIYINRKRVLLINSFGRANFVGPAHDVMFSGGMNPVNGFMGGDSYNFVTTDDLDNVFQSGTNELIIVVRNLSKANDRGGFSFRMDLDSCGTKKQGFIVNNSGSSVATEENIQFSNYPNPFTNNTKFAYTLKADTKVEITAFDMTGKQVAVIQDVKQGAGQHEVEWNAPKLASGMYLIKISTQAEGREATVDVMKIRKL